MLLDDYREYRHYRLFWRLFLAQWIDYLLLLQPLTWLYDLLMPHLTWPPAATLWYGLHNYVAFAYFVLLHARYGQTLGKRLLGIKVLDVSGDPLRPSQAVRRDLVTWMWATFDLVTSWPFLVQGKEPIYPEGGVPGYMLVAGWGMLAWGFAELLVMLTNEKRRSLHDFIAGSVVVRRQKGEWRV
jgi:uncharacterized RDD family membrane protein YckC